MYVDIVILFVWLCSLFGCVLQSVYHMHDTHTLCVFVRAPRVRQLAEFRDEEEKQKCICYTFQTDTESHWCPQNVKGLIEEIN